MNRNFEKLSLDWVKRIFERLSVIYNDRWISSYGNPKTQDIYLSQWASGLSGLNADEIKKALAMCQAFSYANVPSVVEFYHYAKGIREISKPRPSFQDKSNKEISKRYIDQIKSNLSKGVLRGTSVEQKSQFSRP